MQHKQKVKFKNPVLNWIEFRLPIVSYFKKEYGDYPMPKNCNYFWSFGALATIILITMIVSGIFLAMNYTPHIDHHDCEWYIPCNELHASCGSCI